MLLEYFCLQIYEIEGGILEMKIADVKLMGVVVFVGGWLIGMPA